MQESFAFVFFRRMRTPLVVLISAYAIATVGFTLMPGVDDQGNPWRLSLFEAFYVVSFTGSTIGFGEVPYEFSSAQRLWTIVCIYLTVIAWLFSIGTIISLLQDPAFIRTLQRRRFRRAVESIDQPFYLICGFGDTGRLLTGALSSQRYPVVVIDNNRTKIDALAVETHRSPVASFCMDARKPDNLIQGGLRSRWCIGVMAVTGDDRVNLKIAVTARLLNRNCAVHARADRRSVADNMRSFDTHHVVSPVDEYVRRMRLAIEKPATFRLYHWLQSGPGARIPDVRRPPRGHWLLCGFGRLGRALHAMLVEVGMEVTVIEAAADLKNLPEGTVQGRGTQAETLTEAGIDRSVGILATTLNDVDNLSILITARQLNDQLFFGVLENGLSSHALFQAARPDFIGQPSSVIAGNILACIRSPLVQPFFDLLLAREDHLNGDLLDRLTDPDDPNRPELMSLRISERRSPALARMISRGEIITIGAVQSAQGRNDGHRPVTVLLLRRGQRDMLLPAATTELALGDRLLLAGDARMERQVRALLNHADRLGAALSTANQPAAGSRSS